MFFYSELKKGYTLAEILLSIAIIGIMALIVLPNLRNVIPNKENELYKKASYIVEQTAIQLHENETYYPRIADNTKLGFKNTDEVNVNGVKYGGGEADSTERKQKFCRLFARQFNKIKTDSVSCPSDIETDNPSFRSADGIDWWIPESTFEETSDGQIKGYIKIKIDVNGTEKGNNCSAESSPNCKNPDIFYYYIKSNGTVTLADPSTADVRTYKITVKKLINGNETQAGTVEIAQINENGTYGDFSSDEDSFNNLKGNTNYILRVKPPNRYISNWGTKSTNVEAEKRWGYKKVRTTKFDTEVTVELTLIKTSCIKLKVSCDYNSNTSCVNIKKYKYNCTYTNVGENQGDYQKNSQNLDNFEYVGTNKGNYQFQCSNEGDLGDGSNSTLQKCGLESRDYQLYVTPKAGYYIKPKDKNYYQQNVRLGNEDAEFELNIYKY